MLNYYAVILINNRKEYWGAYQDEFNNWNSRERDFFTHANNNKLLIITLTVRVITKVIKKKQILKNNN